MKTKLFYLLFLSLVINSCSSDTETDIQPEAQPEQNEPPALGKQVFRIDFKESASTEDSLEKNQNLEPAFALVSIVDESENEVYFREKFTLANVDGNYETEEIELEAGIYDLTEFIVLDANDIVISLAPKDGSALALFTGTTLPLEFEVNENETNTSDTENFDAAGYTAFDFGYGEVNLDFPENTDFFSLNVDDSDELTPKYLKLESITGSTYTIDWGDGTIEEYASNVTDSDLENSVAHTYSENGVYSITVSGPMEVIEDLYFESRDGEGIYVDIYESHLTAVSLEKLISLKSLHLYQGSLTSIDLSNNKTLELLVLADHELTNVDLTKNLNLKDVSLNNNLLTTLDLSQNTHLERLQLGFNQFTSIDISNNTKLHRFSAVKNSLTDLDLSNNLALRILELDINNFSILNVSMNTELQRLSLNTNQIETIDLSANTKLTGVFLDSNQLTTIDLSANSELEWLNIGQNKLESLDITANPKLFILNFRYNELDVSQLNTLLAQMYERAVSNSIMDGGINYLDNPGTDDVDPTIASNINTLGTDYNWYVNE